jgi:xanthine dehydrogenase accessory factor
MAKVWTRIRQTIERHGSAAFLSAVCAAGSVPRETGALIVFQSDGGFFGSIGGGRLEYEAIAAARAALAAGRRRSAIPRLAARPQPRPVASHLNQVRLSGICAGAARYFIM